MLSTQDHDNELSPEQQQRLALARQMDEDELASHKSSIDTFIAFAKRYEIDLVEKHFHFDTRLGIVAEYPGITEKLLDTVQKDKDGLYRSDALRAIFETNPFDAGYYKAENYFVMAHPFFRRSLHPSNHFAPQFINRYWQLNLSDIEQFIALDDNRIRIDMDNLGYIELDTWFGASFSEDIDRIPDGIIKLRPPLDLEPFHVNFLFGSVYALDVKWSSNQHIKTFQAEEIKTNDCLISINDTLYHPVKYVHAEYDTERKIFQHFDGAIHLYTPNEYLLRRDADLNYNLKNRSHIKAESIKLFKLNGKIPVETWIDLTSHFFSGDPLIIEYFESNYPPHVQEILQAIQMQK